MSTYIIYFYYFCVFLLFVIFVSNILLYIVKHNDSYGYTAFQERVCLRKYAYLLNCNIVGLHKTFRYTLDIIINRHKYKDGVDADFINNKKNPSAHDIIFHTLASGENIWNTLFGAAFMYVRDGVVNDTIKAVCDYFVASGDIDVNLLDDTGEMNEYESAFVFNMFVSVYNVYYSVGQDTHMRSLYFDYIKNGRETGIMCHSKDKPTEESSESFGLEESDKVYKIDIDPVGHQYMDNLFRMHVDMIDVMRKLISENYYSVVEFLFCLMKDRDFKVESTEDSEFPESYLDNDDFMDIMYQVVDHRYSTKDITIGHSKFFPDFCDMILDYYGADSKLYERGLHAVDLRAEYYDAIKKKEKK